MRQRDDGAQIALIRGLFVKAHSPVNVPGGDVVVGDANVLLRVPGEFTDPHELEDVAIQRQGENKVIRFSMMLGTRGRPPSTVLSTLAGSQGLIGSLR